MFDSFITKFNTLFVREIGTYSVDKFRRKVRANLVHDGIADIRVLWGRQVLYEKMSTDVACHDNHRVGEVNFTSVTVGQYSVIQQLNGSRFI